MKALEGLVWWRERRTGSGSSSVGEKSAPVFPRGNAGWGRLHRLPERPLKAGWVSGSEWSGLRGAPWARQRTLEEPGVSAGSGATLEPTGRGACYDVWAAWAPTLVNK